MPKKRQFKVGDLVVLHNPGYPYTRSDDGGDDWTGASAVVSAINAGASRDMIEVELLLPIRVGPGKQTMNGSLFFPTSMRLEDRPWLKRHIKQLFKCRKELIQLARTISEELE